MGEGNGRGRFAWYELMTSDPNAAQTFYTQVTGWGAEPIEFEGSEMEYTMWTSGENRVGGLMELPEEARQGGAPPHWLAYVATDDVDATASQAEELGATILVPPQDIPNNMGRFSVIKDPQGAVFAIYGSAQEVEDVEKPPQVGDFSWRELATTDYEAAFDFYSKLFGWEKTEALDMGEGAMYQMYGRQGTTLGGMFNKPAEMPWPPHWLYYVRVDDVETGVEKVKELGGQVLNGPMEVPGGDKVAQCMDPQGAAFALHSSPS